MKKIIIAYILFVCWCGFGGGVFAQDQEDVVKVDLIRKIIQGHQHLEQSIATLSGNIQYAKSEPDATDVFSGKRYGFYRDGNLLRLNYIHPQKGTEVLSGDERNDITEVIIRSKDYDYQYMAVGTTGVPYANLFKSKIPSTTIESRIQIDFFKGINSLYSLPGGRVLDALQREIGKVEIRPCEDVSDALWLFGPETQSKDGTVSNWIIVLDPNRHYALIYHEAYVKNKDPKRSIVTSCRVKSQKIGDKFVPQELVLESDVYGRRSAEKYHIQIDSTDKPRSDFFVEDTFKDMGRDYVVVNVLPDQKAVGSHVVNAAPPETRTSDYLLLKNPRLAWPWSRIILLVSGIVMVVIACSRMYLGWRNSKNGK